MPAVAKPWCLYGIACRGGGIYVGISVDVEQRYRAHVRRRAALYTRLHPPEGLLGTVWFPCHREAAQMERLLKHAPAPQKKQWLTQYSATSSSCPTTLAAAVDNLAQLMR